MDTNTNKETTLQHYAAAHKYKHTHKCPPMSPTYAPRLILGKGVVCMIC